MKQGWQIGEGWKIRGVPNTYIVCGTVDNRFSGTRNFCDSIANNRE